MVHSSQELKASDFLGVTSLFLVQEVEAAEVNELTGDLERDLILPLVDLRHGEVIKEDNKLLVGEWTIVLSVLLLDFRIDRLLEVVWEGVEREVDSLKGIICRHASRVHEDDRGLGSTSTTNEQSVEETDLLTLFRAHLVESS